MTSKIFNAILKEGRDKHGDDWMKGKSYKYIGEKIKSHIEKWLAGSDGDEDSAFSHIDIIEFYAYSIKLFKAYPHYDDRKNHG